MAGSTELLSPWPCEPTVNMCTAGILAVGSKSGTAVRSTNRLVHLFSLAMQKKVDGVQLFINENYEICRSNVSIFC